MGTKRYDSNSGGEREIQRTMLELLNQLDGFDSRGDTKVRIKEVDFIRTEFGFSFLDMRLVKRLLSRRQ